MAESHIGFWFLELGMRNEAIESLGDDGVGLRVEFTWRGDRFGHVISVISRCGKTQHALESIEGSATDAWPASPPFQSLTLQSLADGRSAALLVGMAGQNHWSASVEADAGQAKLIFDVACRHSPSPGWLGSQYRLLSDMARRCVIRAENGRIVYESESVTIEPVSPTKASPTTRWRYTLCFSPTSDL